MSNEAESVVSLRSSACDLNLFTGVSLAYALVWPREIPKLFDFQQERCSGGAVKAQRVFLGAGVEGRGLEAELKKNGY